MGAGASYEFGLPLGTDLRGQIQQLLNFGPGKGNDAIRSVLMGEHGKEGVMAAQQLREALHTTPSIDRCLTIHSGNRAMELAGKLAIASSILAAEKKSSLYGDRTRPFSFDALPRTAHEDKIKLSSTWLAKLFQLIQDDVDKSFPARLFQNISFVTFNYDRCIEQYLIHAAQALLAIDQNSAVELARSVPVFHAYGDLGALPGLQARGEQPVGFGEDVEDRGGDLRRIAGDIRTFTEEQNSRRLQLIQEAMGRAHQVIFLGCAFHGQNLELLTPVNPPRASKVYATTLGLSAPDSSQVAAQIIHLLRGRSGQGSPGTSSSVEASSAAKMVQDWGRTWQALKEA